MEEFISDCRLSFEAYAKNVREKAGKCFLRIDEVLLDADGHALDIWQRTVVQNYFKSHKNY